MADKPKTDEQTVVSLLKWARDESIAINKLRVGTIELELVDMALATRAVHGSDKGGRDRTGSLYRQYAGDIIDKIEAELGTTFEDDDEEGVDEAPSVPQARRGRSARAPRRG